jgi:hypothetical protein
MCVFPVSKFYLEQSAITEFISHLSCPAPGPQPITPPGVLPIQAPPACCCSPSFTPNGEGSPTAKPSAEKRKREKMRHSTALTTSAPPPPRLGLGTPRARRHRRHRRARTAVTPMALHQTMIGEAVVTLSTGEKVKASKLLMFALSSALTPVTAGLRLVAGARRAIPRRIHGVRLAVCTAIPRCLGCVWIRRAPVGRRRRRRLPTPYG